MDKRIEEIKQREAKATPGPWLIGMIFRSCKIDHGEGNWHGKPYCVYTSDGGVEPAEDEEDEEDKHDIVSAAFLDTPLAYEQNDPSKIAGNYDYEEGGIVHPDDTEFIAHARRDIPYLLLRLEAAEAALEASVGLYQGDVAPTEAEVAMQTWHHAKEADRG